MILSFTNRDFFNSTAYSVSLSYSLHDKILDNNKTAANLTDNSSNGPLEHNNLFIPTASLSLSTYKCRSNKEMTVGRHWRKYRGYLYYKETGSRERTSMRLRLRFSTLFTLETSPPPSSRERNVDGEEYSLRSESSERRKESKSPCPEPLEGGEGEGGDGGRKGFKEVIKTHK
jgi:hypothetical protein